MNGFAGFQFFDWEYVKYGNNDNIGTSFQKDFTWSFLTTVLKTAKHRLQRKNKPQKKDQFKLITSFFYISEL